MIKDIDNRDFIPRYKLIFRDFSFFGSLDFFIFYIILLYFLTLNLTFFKKIIVTIILSYIFVTFIRLIFFKERPIPKKYNNLLEKIDASSFPSMHMVRISILTYFSYIYLNNINILHLFLLLSILVGLNRYLSKWHYIIDIISGFIFGICISYVINNINFL
jgi:membrane-associated phospholipid phosphatase